MTSQQKTARTSPAANDYLPGLAVDAVIFGFNKNQLKILVLEYRNTGLYALPGGFVRTSEDLNTAARRVLAERTGLSDIYLHQFYTFGDVARYDPAPMKLIMKQLEQPIRDDHWMLGRFISVGYYALVDFSQVVPQPDFLSDSCGWYGFENLPPLMQDHNGIVNKALETLRVNLDRQLIASNLLPATFTIGDLQSLYETVLGVKLNRSSFQRRVLGLDILERVEKKYTGGAHRAPYLYRFR
jgi:ADP-ribose pyrophosphatase YjhB (NUDIX family)